MSVPWFFRIVSVLYPPYLRYVTGKKTIKRKVFALSVSHPVCAVRGTGELKKRSQIESNENLHFRSTSEKSELYL